MRSTVDSQEAGPVLAADATPAVGAANAGRDPAEPLADPATRSRFGALGRRWTARTGAWRNPDFIRLWSGMSVSQLGSQVTLVALPLVAIQLLHTDAAGMGVLGALGRLPFLLYLLAGVFVDRTRRRAVLIGTDLARAALLVLIPVAWFAGVLHFWLLAVILFMAMLLTVWFDTAYMSYLPSLVDRSTLMQANTGLETSRSTTQLIGPSIGGVLVQALSAPVAVLLDAASYLVSAFAVKRIRTAEPEPGAGQSPGIGGIVAAVGEGLRFTARHRILAPLALAIGVSNVAWAAELALYLIYLAKGLGLGAAMIGLTLAAAGPGALLGSALAGRVQHRFGLAAAIIGGLTLFAGAALLIPLTPARPVIAVPVLMLAAMGMSTGGQICAVNVLTTRQSLTPDRLQGRVNASFRFLALGISPLGALAGGAAGQLLGIRAGLLIAVAGMFLAPLIVLVSPVRRVRRVPGAEPEPSAAATEPEPAPS